MEKNIKLLTDQYFNSIFFWWFALVITIYLYISEVNEGLLKYATIALIIFTGIKFLNSMYNVFNFTDKNSIKNKDILKTILPAKEFKKRTVFNYLKFFPSEHPYILLSIIGLVFTEQFTGYSGELHQSMENVPILNSIFPSLLIIILFLVFSDYTYHINAKYVRRAFKIVIMIYSPFIIGFFFVGLFGPIILIIKGMFNIFSFEDIKVFFLSFENLFWLIVYPWTVFYILKCTFIENQQMIQDKES